MTNLESFISVLLALIFIFHFILGLLWIEMSMILSASVIRVRDGLPLSASTDYEQGTGVQECRKYFKMLSRKLAQLPDRCTLKTGRYNIK